jgi:hypothetical protein
MKLKKGSAAAKAYMAKIRAKRKKVKKSTIAKPKRAARKVVKAARKKAAKKMTSIHKDTASHNVRISVVSGFEKYNSKQLDELNHIYNMISNIEIRIDRLKSGIKYKKYTPEDVKKARILIKKDTALIKSYKKNASEIKKHIK